MSEEIPQGEDAGKDLAPGDSPADVSIPQEVRGYAIGLGLAALLTVASFALPSLGLVWRPGVPVALMALAVGQMGVHLVFFLHVTSGPDNTNNVLALAFGVLIVALVLIGTLWIMANLSHAIMPMDQLMKMQR